MEVRNNLQRISAVSQSRPAFKGKAYVPKGYRNIRDLENTVIENSKGVQKMLINLEKKSGETLNNIVTAVGTACIAPIFITYNPFSKEEKETKAYSAWRQPLSAVITLGAQIPLMKVYNNWLDKHSVLYGAEEMNLRAKPPASTLKARAKLEYKEYTAECNRTGQDIMKKSEWVSKRVIDLQDDAFYKELRHLRATMDISKLDPNKLVQSSAIDEAANGIFKQYLVDKHGFNIDELEKIKEFKDLSKKHKSIIKNRGIKFKDIEEPILKLAKEKALNETLDCINQEARVKFATSQAADKMKNEFIAQKTEIMKKYGLLLKDAEQKATAAAEEAAKAVKAANATPADKALKIIARDAKAAEEKAKSTLEMLNKNGINNMETECSTLKKRLYDKFVETFEKEVKSMDEKDPIRKLKEYAFEKIKKAGSYDNIKYHGSKLDDSVRSVTIKKWLTTLINESEKKLKGLKDRSGILFGLAILPFTCGLLNWVYPRIMEKYFPELVAAKKAKAAAFYMQPQPQAVKAKEAK